MGIHKPMRILCLIQASQPASDAFTSPDVHLDVLVRNLSGRALSRLPTARFLRVRRTSPRPLHALAVQLARLHAQGGAWRPRPGCIKTKKMCIKGELYCMCTSNMQIMLRQTPLAREGIPRRSQRTGTGRHSTSTSRYIRPCGGNQLTLASCMQGYLAKGRS